MKKRGRGCKSGEWCVWTDGGGESKEKVEGLRTVWREWREKEGELVEQRNKEE